MRPQHLPQAEGDARWRATHPTGQVDDERVFGIHRHALLGQLLLQVQRGRAVAQQQRKRLLVVHKVAQRVAGRLGTACGHGTLVVAQVLHHQHAPLAQAVFLPFLGIGRHVHRGLKTQGRRHHANAHAQVARGAHRHLVAAQHLARLRHRQRTVVTAGLHQVVLQCQPLGKLQHLVHAAPGLDGARHRQAVVGLDEQAALVVGHAQCGRQRRSRQQGGLHHTACGGQLGEHLRQQRGKTGQACSSRLRIIQTNAST